MDRGRVCSFPLPNRGPKEDRRQEATVHSLIRDQAGDWWCMRGSPSPRSIGQLRTVKSFTKNSPGANTEVVDRRRVAGNP